MTCISQGTAPTLPYGAHRTCIMDALISGRAGCRRRRRRRGRRGRRCNRSHGVRCDGRGTHAVAADCGDGERVRGTVAQAGDRDGRTVAGSRQPAGAGRHHVGRDLLAVVRGEREGHGRLPVTGRGANRGGWVDVLPLARGVPRNHESLKSPVSSQVFVSHFRSVADEYRALR